MPNFNQLTLVGHLTRDPELTVLPSNTAVTGFAIAVNREFKKADGTKQKQVMFIDAHAFGKTAETINQYFKKGKPILVAGRLELQQWTSKDGQKRSKHAMVVETFQFIEAAASKTTDSAVAGSEDSEPGESETYIPLSTDTAGIPF